MHRCNKCGGLMEKSVRAEHTEDLGGVVVKILNAVQVLRCAECETEMVSIPDLDDLGRATVISRALNPVRLAGREVKFLRRVLDMTQVDFAKAMDLRPETVSRWENDTPGVGGACEKLTRHNVCALLSKMARGRSYDPADIAKMELVEPTEGYELPPIEMVRVRVSSPTHDADGWGEMAGAA
jgi:DNA-binding XRE family transcriptional regulator